MKTEILSPVEEQHVEWSRTLMRVYEKYPSSIRSKLWPGIVKRANLGDYEGAVALAKKTERTDELYRRNVVARRMRIERVSLFTRLAKAEKDLKDVFDKKASRLGDYLEKKATETKNIPLILERIRETTTELRRDLRVLINSVIRDSTKLGLRNPGNALLPIFKDNWEVTQVIEQEMNLFERVPKVELVKQKASRIDPRIMAGSKKWRSITKKVMTAITKKSISGLTPSERIWDLTQRAETDLRRIVTNSMAQGESSYKIADKTKKFLSTKEIDKKLIMAETGRGVYRSPFRNALRLARTESNRAYTHASAEWARNKDFIKGIMITLSPAHTSGCICDDYAGKVVSPDEFQNLVPFHPNCMCYPTYTFQDDFVESMED